MLRFFCSFITFLLISLIATGQAQPRSNYKLLWKISGNGLKKPSYLFGTMHVQDNKAFDFSDSVLLKINACEAFALEVHPDSVMKVLLVTLMKGREDENQLRQDLSETQYSYLDSLMKERTGKSLQTFNSYKEINDFLVSQFGKKDKDTFLDSWLYKIARNQEKLILGLEPLNDQLKLSDNLIGKTFEELKKYLEQDYQIAEREYQHLLDLYYAGDIEEMKNFSVKNSQAGFYDDLITKRNVVMANGIATSVQERTTFAAIGAAHLAGEDGVIQLLKNKGYEVTPVKPTFTGLAERYQSNNAPQKWFVYSAPRGAYSIEMPHAPAALKMPGVPMTFQSALEFGSMTIFFATHTPIMQGHQDNPAELLKKMTEAIAARGKLSNSKNIEVSGNKGLDFVIESEGISFRVQIILRDSFAYLLMAGSKDATTPGEDADRFFSSIKFKPIEKGNGSPKEFVQAAGAFSIDMPGEVTEQTNAPPDQPRYKVQIYYAVDTKSPGTFLVRYNDFPPGLVSINDSLYMHQSLELVTTNMKGSDLQTEAAVIQGLPGLRYEFNTGEFKAIGNTMMRGNRFYLTMALRPNSANPEASNTFLNSFRFLPYQNTPAYKMNFPEGVSLLVPEKFVQDSTMENTDGTKRYSFLDRNSGINFVLQVETLSQYSQAKDRTTYFNDIKETLLEEEDSVIKENPIEQQQGGHEYWVKSKKANAIKRIRFLLADNYLISLWGFFPSDYTQSNLPDEVFDSFKVKAEGTWSLFDIKTDLILKDIVSPDSITQATARNAIREHPFELTDLPKIYKALAQTYQDDGEYYGGTRRALFTALSKHHDATTLPFIQNLYTQLPDTTLLRDHALKVLASMKTENSIQAMVEIMKQDSRNMSEYMVLNSFYDSLQLLNPVVEQLMAFESRFGSCYNLFDLIKTAIDSSALRPDINQKVIHSVITMANRLVGKTLPAPEADNYYDEHSKLVNLAELLGALPFTPELRVVMTKLHQLHDPEIMSVTSIQLLKNAVPVSSNDLATVAAEPLFRLQLYRNLKEIGHEKRFPKKYRTQKMIAESELYEYINYDDGTPYQFKFVLEKQVEYEGTRQRIFIYKFNYEEESVWYYGLSGPYPIKVKGNLPSGALTTSFYNEYENESEMLDEIKKYVEENGGKWLK